MGRGRRRKKSQEAAPEARTAGEARRGARESPDHQQVCGLRSTWRGCLVARVELGTMVCPQPGTGRRRQGAVGGASAGWL